jgi:hypothetical protein
MLFLEEHRSTSPIQAIQSQKGYRQRQTHEAAAVVREIKFAVRRLLRPGLHGFGPPVLRRSPPPLLPRPRRGGVGAVIFLLRGAAPVPDSQGDPQGLGRVRRRPGQGQEGYFSFTNWLKSLLVAPSLDWLCAMHQSVSASYVGNFCRL